MSRTDKRVKIEFIESYIKDEGSDYTWNDNHGELIRCRDCKRYDSKNKVCLNNNTMPWNENDYCSMAEKR